MAFDAVPVTCPVQQRYHSIAACLAGISTPAEQAQALNVGYSTITRWLREFREKGMPGLFSETEYPREPYTPERVIVQLIFFKCCVPKAGDRELARVIYRLTGHHIDHHTVKSLCDRYFFWRYSDFQQLIRYPVPTDPQALRLEVAHLSKQGHVERKSALIEMCSDGLLATQKFIDYAGVRLSRFLANRTSTSKYQGANMKTDWSRRQFVSALSLLLALSTFFSIPTSNAQQRRSATTARSSVKKPRLVVGIVIDQFRYNYLTRFEDQFGEGGFKRLLNGGAVFTNANYIHTPTYTACGHATFMSGATPAMNGIVGNEWYDRDSGKRVTSVSDDKTKLLGGREGATGMSPHRLVGTTVGDEMKLASGGKSKVIGISYKDRSAILPSGKRPNGAYWFNADTGNFVSSTYYFEDLPSWVKSFNHDQHCGAYFGKTWERLLPEGIYQRSEPDDAPYEKSLYGRRFPYTINGGEEKPGGKFYNQFEASPFANEHLANFARAAIENEGLGTDDVTDLLTVSFSSNDLVGHAFGPYSQEVQDMTLRLDRTLAELFNYLDKKIGLDQVIIALTADHGVGPVPEQVRALGYGGRVDAKSATDAITSALNQRFGEEKWILNFVNGNIYLDEAAIERRKLDLAEVENVASQAVGRIHGIAAAITGTQIMTGRLPNSPIANSVANGFFPPRNGNLIIVPRPFYLFGEGITASHGTPYSYDTHVPVILFGAGVAAGSYATVSSPADIAPTLSLLLKVEKPSNAVGRILTEAIRER